MKLYLLNAKTGIYILQLELTRILESNLNYVHGSIWNSIKSMKNISIHCDLLLSFTFWNLMNELYQSTFTCFWNVSNIEPITSTLCSSNTTTHYSGLLCSSMQLLQKGQEAITYCPLPVFILLLHLWWHNDWWWCYYWQG